MSRAWDSARNLLCVRLDTLGDVLMSTPAMRALKHAHPGRRIALMTSPPGAAVARLVPEIDEVLVYDAPWMKATAPRADSRPEYAMAERLRASAYDAAVIFTVYSQTAMPAAFLCYMAGIPLRLAHSHENPYQLLSDWVPDPEPHSMLRHEVQRQLELVASVGCCTPDERMSLRVPAGAAERVRALLGARGVDLAGRWLVIHAGASAPSRRYPPESFAAAARELMRADGLQIVFTGTAPERELVDGIRAALGAPSVSLAGELDLGEMAALLAQAPVLIANNTGPVHMAAALGTPVVDLYALTNPQHTPWGVAHRVLSYDVPCKYCYRSVCPEGHHDCLRRVAPGEVVRAARELLAEAARPRPPAVEAM